MADSTISNGNMVRTISGGSAVTPGGGEDLLADIWSKVETL